MSHHIPSHTDSNGPALAVAEKSGRGTGTRLADLPQHAHFQSSHADILRVAVVSDHDIITFGATGMLSLHDSRILVVDSSGTSTVDITLIDASLTTRAGVAALDRAIDDPRAGAVVHFVWNVCHSTAQRALDRGCAGCLGKALGPDELVTALERIGRGDIVISPGSVSRRAPGSRTEAMGPCLGHSGGLSRREEEVISLITLGFRNLEIADQLFVSINTVKTYVRSAYRKIGAESRSEAVRWGMEHGMTCGQQPHD